MRLMLVMYGIIIGLVLWVLSDVVIQVGQVFHHIAQALS